MSKRVSIMLPDEMPADPSGNTRHPKPSRTLKSLIKNRSSARTQLAPPVFVVVSPESSQCSLTSGQRNNTSTTNNSSLNQRIKMDSEERLSGIEEDRESNLESRVLLQSGSSNSSHTVNFDSTSTSIRKFLKSTVDFVRAGESFTSAKHFFHKFVKRSDSMSNSKPSMPSSCCQAVGEENPYMSKSNDTLLTDSAIPTAVPIPFQMTAPLHFSNYSFNNTNYDLYNLLSDITPLTGYTPVGLTEDADYRTDTSTKTALNSVNCNLANSSEDHLGSGFDNSLSSTVSPGQVKVADTKRRPSSKDRSSSRYFLQKPKTSRASLRKKSPKMSPRTNQSVPAIGPIFAMVSSSGPNSSEGSRRSSLRRQQSPLPNGVAKISTTSNSRPNIATATTSRKENSPRSSRSRKSFRLSSPRRPSRGTRASALESPYLKSEDTAAKVEYAFALVSPEEAGNSQPDESSADVEDASSSCQTYQKHCTCHHCQDVRRAVKRSDFFKSPEGQKRLEAKLLAKNFFMDICVLSEVRHRVQSDLHGTRRHPSARLSYPVSICGATRLSGGSLSLQWITHDLDSIDHFDVFVDNIPSRSVYNRQATYTVLVDVNTAQTHTLRLRAVPERGSRVQDSSVDKFMSEVVAGHMRHVRQGQLFARCFEHLDARPQQRTLVDFWTDSEFLYMPTRDFLPPTKAR